jgi:hypothetical protein
MSQGHQRLAEKLKSETKSITYECIALFFTRGIEAVNKDLDNMPSKKYCTSSQLRQRDKLYALKRSMTDGLNDANSYVRGKNKDFSPVELYQRCYNAFRAIEQYPTLFPSPGGEDKTEGTAQGEANVNIPRV